MRHATRIFSLFLMTLGALICVSALRLPYYTPLGPGAGFFPFWLSLALMALSLFCLLERRTDAYQKLIEDFPDLGGALRISGVFLSITSASFFIEKYGFIIPLMTVLLMLQLILGEKRILRIVMMAGVIPIICQYIFRHYLGISLPTGPLGI